MQQPAEAATPEYLKSTGEAPKPAEPDKSAAAVPSTGAQFLPKEECNDWFARNLIGETVVNANNETIGDVNDFVTDQSGKSLRNAAEARPA